MSRPVESDVLLTPTPKKTKGFIERQYPFPIFIKNDGRPPSDNRAGNSSTAIDGLKPKWKCIRGHLQQDCVLVTDKESMMMLYNMGFFGKGTLSRGAPRICFPPKLFKEEASKESLLKKGNECEEEESSSEEDKPKRRKVDTSEDVKPALDVAAYKSSSSSSSSDDDNEESSSKEPLDEHLQLTFEEAFFLSYALGCFVVMDRDKPLDLLRLWQKLCELTMDKNFPITYTAYHHFRSKGWIVRSGLKYGADFVLYKEGPPFFHSTYSVIVKPVKEKHLKDINQDGRSQLTWASLAAINRINSHTAKGVLLLYVIKPEMMSEYKVSTPFCVAQFKLQEVIVKRWVSSTGREDES